jgi:hypothetical protein
MCRPIWSCSTRGSEARPGKAKLHASGCARPARRHGDASQRSPRAPNGWREYGVATNHRKCGHKAKRHLHFPGPARASRTRLGTVIAHRNSSTEVARRPEIVPVSGPIIHAVQAQSRNPCIMAPFSGCRGRHHTLIRTGELGSTMSIGVPANRGRQGPPAAPAPACVHCQRLHRT